MAEDIKKEEIFEEVKIEELKEINGGSIPAMDLNQSKNDYNSSSEVEVGLVTSFYQALPN